MLPLTAHRNPSHMAPQGTGTLSTQPRAAELGTILLTLLTADVSLVALSPDAEQSPTPSPLYGMPWGANMVMKYNSEKEESKHLQLEVRSPIAVCQITHS